MSMKRRNKRRQRPMFIANTAVVGSPGHRFYEALEQLLRAASFDAFVEGRCASYYAAEGHGRPSIAPGVYFRMLLVGFFEGIESERGICWRCADSLSLKAFLGFEPHEAVPDHSTLSRTRTRLSESVYQEVFDFVLGMVASAGLLSGKVTGVDSTYLRADASMKSIVRRDSGESYNAFLKRLAEAEGIVNPSADDLRRMDRGRKGKKCSNKDWGSPVDSDARISRMKDGTTRLAHKAEHVVDMQSGAIINADIVEATKADSASIGDSLEAADDRIERVVGDDDDEAPSSGANASTEPKRAKHIEEVTGDKGYHKAATIRTLERRGVRTYIAEPKYKGKRRWKNKGGYCTRRAVYNNRARTKRPKGRALQRRRGELIERTFAHICETGGHRRTRLRGRGNIRKRYLIHVAGFNLALVLRKILGYGTPRALANAAEYWLRAASKLVSLLFVLCGTIVAVTTGRRDAQHTPLRCPTRRRSHTLWTSPCGEYLREPAFSTGC